VDFAALCMGAVTVPIYPTLLPEGAAYILQDSGSKVLFVQGMERLEGLLALRNDIPDVEHIILTDGDDAGEGFDTLANLLNKTDEPDIAVFEEMAKRSRPEDVATFIYTSGTTGNPKGVMLTHRNLVANVLSAAQCIPINDTFTALCFLPLSHSFERLVDYLYFYQGVTIAYAESVQTVGENLGEVKPNIFVSVPRIYEKVQGRIYENVAKSSPLKQRIFRWALDVGRQALEYRLRLETPPGLLGLKLSLADKLVFGKIRDRLGGRFKFAISGGAPLSQDIAEFFWGAGIRIYEGYGLTETSPVLTVNTVEKIRPGTVGPAIPDVELRIAEDGEILARGPNIMKGYYKNDEATREAIDADGWFHTGDIGEIQDGIFLKITDRKKELIVNAYGKNIAPAPIENLMKASRFIGQAVVLGDKRKFLSALIVPDFETLKPWTEQQGVKVADPDELCRHPEVRSLFQREVEAVNDRLARFEQLRAWELLPNEFTLETGELTPTQKVKRRVIREKYREVIDRLYESADAEGL
jgi:long-chain acyl-CoA synthetase